jgi:iron complex outermembrane recepter protein
MNLRRSPGPLSRFRANARFVLVACLACGQPAARAAPEAGATESRDDFTELSLEELDALSISAASKRSQPLFETPAAVSVLLPVDIRRAGHASTSEALRLVPGVHTIHHLPGRASVGIRGSNGIQSTKLLVLVDGRSVYGPFYGSVEWDNADVEVDDLSRIEVVRGPGATLWGANAVNGVINIISKDARDTQGGVLSVRGGTAEPARVHVRHGGQLGERTWYRLSATGKDTAGALGALRDDPVAEYTDYRANLRTDSVLGERFHFTTQVEHLKSTRKIDGDPSTHQLSSVMTRLQGREIAGGELQIQFYYDRSKDRAGLSDRGGADGLPFALNEDFQDFDLDVVHHVRLGAHNDVIWGGGARHTNNKIVSTQNLFVADPEADSWLYNFFVQDEIALTPKQLRLTLGTKVEHHATIGWQLLPNARLAWLPNPRHTLWAAVSRAVRAPSRGEREVVLTLARVAPTLFTPAVRFEVTGHRDFDAEINKAHEIGWRWRPHSRFQTDVTAYYFDYDDVRSFRSFTWFEPGAVPTVVQRLSVFNDGEAETYGGEASCQWRIGDGWELAGSVSRGIAHTENVMDNLLLNADYAIPAWLWHVRSWWQLPRDFEFSLTLYGTGKNHRAVPGESFLRLDAQLVWRPRPDMELAVGVQNATDPNHSETITGPLIPAVDVRRNVYARIQWRF